MPEVLHPNRCVGQNHADSFSRRRGIGRSLGMDPPSATNALALSRAMSSSSPRCTKAVFSRIPVSRRASSSNSSSRFIVVFICMSMYDSYILAQGERRQIIGNCRLPTAQASLDWDRREHRVLPRYSQYCLQAVLRLHSVNTGKKGRIVLAFPTGGGGARVQGHTT